MLGGNPCHVHVKMKSLAIIGLDSEPRACMTKDIQATKGHDIQDHTLRIFLPVLIGFIPTILLGYSALISLN